MIGVIIAVMAAVTIFVATNTHIITQTIRVSSDGGTVKMPIPTSDNINFNLFSGDMGGVIYNSIPVELNVYTSTSESTYMEIPGGWAKYMRISENTDSAGNKSVDVTLDQIQTEYKDGKETKTTFTFDSAPLIVDFYTTSKSPNIDLDDTQSYFLTISLKDFKGDNVTLYSASDTIKVTGSTLHTLTLPAPGPGHITLSDSSIDSIISEDENHPVITMLDDSIKVEIPDKEN